MRILPNYTLLCHFDQTTQLRTVSPVDNVTVAFLSFLFLAIVTGTILLLLKLQCFIYLLQIKLAI